MKLSIITVCKNEFPFIRETCESVARQIFQDFEWIVMDGASTDGSLDVFEKYKHRISRFVSEPDAGIYAAMNGGIRSARGEFVLFLNGGDMLFDAGALEKAAPFLNDSADVFYGDSYRLFENPKDCFIKVYPDQLEKSYFLTNSLGHQSMFTKKSLFDKYGPYREDNRIVSDKEKMITFLENGARFRHLNFPVARFRMNGISRIKSAELAAEKQRMFREHGMI
jgi:glycosyltransferase involved in cell wall biosynthesis